METDANGKSTRGIEMEDQGSLAKQWRMDLHLLLKALQMQREETDRRKILKMRRTLCG